eukprot:TRINITY_DN8709_c0_g1_i5.p1 TRINITY_DN8709_c0_g1~~TRINITY_DN8709_c0_g1_i5.p1  ORF type:complete len:968 (-),score=212.08 TRINITY_DN8709_c0_g1_i5:141-3044(-)
MLPGRQDGDEKEKVIRSGYLEKTRLHMPVSGSAVFSGWSKRFFVLQSDKVVWYLSHDDTEPKGELLLTPDSIVEAGDGALRIQGAGDRRLLVRPPAPETTWFFSDDEDEQATSPTADLLAWQSALDAQVRVLGQKAERTAAEPSQMPSVPDPLQKPTLYKASETAVVEPKPTSRRFSAEAALKRAKELATQHIPKARRDQSWNETKEATQPDHTERLADDPVRQTGQTGLSPKKEPVDEDRMEPALAKDPAPAFASKTSREVNAKLQELRQKDEHEKFETGWTQSWREEAQRQAQEDVAVSSSDSVRGEESRVPSRTDAICEGYLEKAPVTRSSIFGGWSRRYIVLTPDRVKWFKQSDDSEPQNEMELDNAASVELCEGSLTVKSHGKVLVLREDTAGDPGSPSLASWHRAIKEQLFRMKASSNDLAEFMQAEQQERLLELHRSAGQTLSQAVAAPQATSAAPEETTGSKARVLALALPQETSSLAAAAALRQQLVTEMPQAVEAPQAAIAAPEETCGPKARVLAPPLSQETSSLATAAALRQELTTETPQADAAPQPAITAQEETDEPNAGVLATGVSQETSALAAAADIRQELTTEIPQMKDVSQPFAEDKRPFAAAAALRQELTIETPQVIPTSLAAEFLAERVTDLLLPAYAGGSPTPVLQSGRTVAPAGMSLQLREVGRLAAIDVLLNNSERALLPLWQSQSRLESIVLSRLGSGVRAKGQRVHVVKDDLDLQRYLSRVRFLVAGMTYGSDVCAGLHGDLAATPIAAKFCQAIQRVLPHGFDGSAVVPATSRQPALPMSSSTCSQPSPLNRQSRESCEGVGYDSKAVRSRCRERQELLEDVRRQRSYSDDRRSSRFQRAGCQVPRSRDNENMPPAEQRRLTPEESRQLNVMTVQALIGLRETLLEIAVLWEQGDLLRCIESAEKALLHRLGQDARPCGAFVRRVAAEIWAAIRGIPLPSMLA